MRLLVVTTISVALLLTGCEWRQNRDAPKEEPFRSLATDFGAEYANDHLAIVYIGPHDGRALKGCANSFCDAYGGIRVTVHSGQPIDPSPHVRLETKHGDFSYYLATDGSLSPFGVVRYSPSGQPEAWIQLQYGDGPPIDTANGELVTPGYAVEYNYKGSTEQQHAAAYRAVLSFCRAAKLIREQPNNSSKPTPLRGAA